MNKIGSFLWLIGFLFCIREDISAQAISDDSVKFDYNKIYSFCLDANVRPALALVEGAGPKKISPADAKFRADLENRFTYAEDRGSYSSGQKPGIDELLQLFRGYWRMSLLDEGKNNDTLLITELTDFLNKNHLPVKGKISIEDSIDLSLRKYIENKGLHTNGLGKTGRLFDLLVWRTQKDTVYSFVLQKEEISARVILMDNFLTLGWEEYATLQRYYPGGWATTDALYCVRKGYDLKSEDFLISYLAHESRHFADYKIFPKLSSPDLEYRAKLTELSMAKETLYRLIDFFIHNANYESDNGHSVANYCAIRDLSQALFNVGFEKDTDTWKKIGVKEINEAAYKILQSNTAALQLKGPGVEKYIKP